MISKALLYVCAFLFAIVAKDSYTYIMIENELNTINMKQFIITVQHDEGTTRIRTSASSEKQARINIMNAELCPESAIIRVEKINH